MQMFVVLLKAVVIFFISLKLEFQFLFYFNIGYFNGTAIGDIMKRKLLINHSKPIQTTGFLKRFKRRS